MTASIKAGSIRVAACWLARAALAGFFIYASWHKIVEPATFAKDIYNYQLLPSSLINAAAIFLPWLEMLCGLALLFAPSLRKGATALILLMLVVFTAAIASALARGLDISCGCFTSGDQGDAMSWLSLVRNAVLMGLCAMAWPKAARA